jgi:hypothetical protein
MGKPEFAKNIEVIGYHDLDGKPGFQMAMQEVDGRYYLYMSHFRHSGWAILDVTDPTKPEYVKFVPGPDKAGQFCPKLQVAGGLRITALSQLFPFLHGTSWDDPNEEGVYIWDVKDPVNPKWLSHWKTGGALGVHRFYYDGGQYAHLSTACRGFTGWIYRILDVSDPSNPFEAGRWWAPEQYKPSYIQPKKSGLDDAAEASGMLELLDGPHVHGPAYPKGDNVYISYGGAGVVILDISDPTLPQLIGQLKIKPPFSGGRSGARCHTVIPLSQRPYAVVSTEGERYPVFSKAVMKGKPQPMNMIGMVDISDPTDPTLISVFPYPEVPPGYPWKNFNEHPEVGVGPFGPHNLHEPHYHPALEDRNDRVYCCYFHAGLRVYDISDPFVPREIAYYLPPDPDKFAFNNATGDLFPGPNISVTEDVIVDNRGNIFIDTLHQGLYVLRCTV